MKNSKMGKKLVSIILGAGLLAESIFCAGKYATANPKGNAFRDFLGYTAAETFTKEVIKKEMGHSDYQKQERQQQRYKDNETPVGLFAYTKWVDLNENGGMDDNELFGLGKKVFNLNKEALKIGIRIPDYEGNVNYKLWNSRGDLAGKKTIYKERDSIAWISFDKGTNLEAGNYKISATLDNKKTEVIDVTIVK